MNKLEKLGYIKLNDETYVKKECGSDIYLEFDQKSVSKYNDTKSCYDSLEYEPITIEELEIILEIIKG